jgi:four helix bundle suffix protein
MSTPLESGSDRSNRSDESAGSPGRPKRLRPSGGYRITASFQTATIIYDATYWFCEKFVESRSRSVDQMVQAWLDHAKPGVRANAIICLIHQANYLLDQQINALEQAFVEEGGYSEQLATARLARRTHRDSSDPPDPSDLIPQCPRCGKPMALRTAKTGKHAGNQFWGCTGYPDCKGTAVI